MGNGHRERDFNSWISYVTTVKLRGGDWFWVSGIGIFWFIVAASAIAGLIVGSIGLDKINRHHDDDSHDGIHKIESEDDLKDIIYEDDVNGGYLDDDNHLWGINGGLFIPLNLTVNGKTNLNNDLNINEGDIIQTGGDIITDGSITAGNFIGLLPLTVATSESSSKKRTLPINVIEPGKAVGCANEHCHIKQGFSTFDAMMINDTFVRSKSTVAEFTDDWQAVFHFQQSIDDDDNAQLVMNLVKLEEDNALTINTQILVDSTDFDLTYDYDVRAIYSEVENHMIIFYNSPTTLQPNSTSGNVWSRVIRVVDPVTNSVLIGSPFVINLEPDSAFLPGDVAVLSHLGTSVDLMFAFTESGSADDGLSIRGCTADTSLLTMSCSVNEPSTLNTSHNNAEDITQLSRQPGTETSLLPCGVVLFGGCNRDEDYWSGCTDTQLNIALISRSGGVVNIQYDAMDMPSLYSKTPITWTFEDTWLDSTHVLVSVEDLLGYNHGFTFVVEFESENVCAFSSVNNVTSTVARIGPVKPIDIYTIQDSGAIFQELVMPISSLTTLDENTAVIAFRQDFKQSHELDVRLVHVDLDTLEITYGHDTTVAPFLSRDVDVITTSEDSFVIVYSDYSPSSLALDDYSLLEVSHCTRIGKDTISCSQQTPEELFCIAKQGGTDGDLIECITQGIVCDSSLFDFGSKFHPGPVFGHCDGSLSMSGHHLAGQATNCVPQIMGRAITRHCMKIEPQFNVYGTGLNV